MRETSVYRNFRCVLSPNEIVTFARALVGTRKCLLQTVRDKSAAMKKFKEDIEILEKEIGRLSQIVDEGCEYREFQCRVLYDDPAAGQKSLYNLAGGELLKIEDMTELER